MKSTIQGDPLTDPLKDGEIMDINFPGASVTKQSRWKKTKSFKKCKKMPKKNVSFENRVVKW